MRSNLTELAANVIEAEEALAEREAELENAISDGVGAQWIESATDLVEMAREDLATARFIYRAAAVAHAMRVA